MVNDMNFQKLRIYGDKVKGVDVRFLPTWSLWSTVSRHI